MKKNRLIPVLLLKNGWLVQSKGFSRYQNLGNPVTAVKRLSEWASDELIYLDISTNDHYDMRRDDQGYKNNNSFLDIIQDVSRVTFMPITVGGRIRTIKDIEVRLSMGADKVSLNTMAVKSHKFLEEAAKYFGSQCIVVSMDAKKIGEEQYKIFSDAGKNETKYTPQDLAHIVEDSGAGEILLNSIDNDGEGDGFDIPLINQVADNVNIPVIACGGAGDWEDFAETMEETKVDAVAAANIFHYRDQSVFLAKKYLYDNGLNFRKPDLITI
jgi:imidazole glycerol-phosphate synthase subunit HisF